jgi:hypothetical protein
MRTKSFKSGKHSSFCKANSCITRNQFPEWEEQALKLAAWISVVVGVVALIGGRRLRHHIVIRLGISTRSIRNAFNAGSRSISIGPLTLIVCDAANQGVMSNR